MRHILTLIITLLAASAFAQQITSAQWEEEAKTNMRLLPKYGHMPKTEAQKQSDQEFIETALTADSTHRMASDHLISLGFKYLNRDVKTAMYRFNQAYLLDSTNVDIYWGYGAVYMTLGQFGEAEKQYLEGLSIEPDNTHLLTDYGTYFMMQYYVMKLLNEEKALTQLDRGISLMSRSYELDPSDQNTSFKLSILFWLKGDCDSAWKYYDACMALGGQPITEAYTKDLGKSCKPKKR